MGKRRESEVLTELERLNEFVALADELGQSTYAKNPTGVRLVMRFAEDSESVNKAEHKSDKDHFRSFLGDFRKFILKKDHVHFFAICGILLRRLPEGELRDIVAKSKAVVSDALQIGKFAIVFGKPTEDLNINPIAEIKGVTVTPEQILGLWIDTMYHTNKRKTRELNRLKEVFGGVPEYTFIDTVNLITNHIGVVRGVIREALRDHPGLFEQT